MAYKAKIHIGKYNPGDIVSDKEAIVWNKMYKDSPVEAVEDSVKAEVKKVPKKRSFLDLNGDGVVDRKDMSIAAKVLGSGRKKRNKK